MTLKYVRVHILVEGVTEETFVRALLEPPLATRGVYVDSRSVETSRRGALRYRGGLSHYAKAKRDIERWLAEDRAAYVTTMFDFYRLPDDFPGQQAAKGLAAPYVKVRHVETEMWKDVGNDRFVPYIQRHEFEGLLYSDVGEIAGALCIFGAASRPKDLAEIRSGRGSPEEINDGEDTAPSKRLLRLYPTYDKGFFGSLIAERIGLEKMRSECPHFDEWLARLENLTPLKEMS